jgi:predicted nucleotidyltransferase
MAVGQERVIELPIDLVCKSTPAGVHPVGFKPLSVDLLEHIVQRIVTGVQPEKIILFGSYAYGNPTPDSDLDLLVSMESQARPAERVLAVSRRLRPRPFPMDILVRAPQEIREALEKKDSFIHEIMTQGKILYEQRSCSPPVDITGGFSACREVFSR